MNNKDAFIIVAFVLLAALWIGWVVSQEQSPGVSSNETNIEKRAVPPIREEEEVASSSSPTNISQQVSEKIEPGDGFPALTIEIVNGKTERTIHTGVWQYVWD